jgi:hypothetical protein
MKRAVLFLFALATTVLADDPQLRKQVKATLHMTETNL